MEHIELDNKQERNLHRRINRALRSESQRLHKLSVRDRLYNEFGPYYIRDTDANFMVAWGIHDLHALASELGLMN